MTDNSSKNLVLTKFVKRQFKAIYEEKTQEEIEKYLKNLDEGTIEQHADHEEIEVGKDQLVLTSYPKPDKIYRIVHETYQNSIEEAYYWVLDYMRSDCGFFEVDKITDVLAASETSAFGGVIQQRIGLQQDKVSQFLATIGKMVKELFQIVRELRILDERMGYYVDAKSENRTVAIPADITLKGLFIDMAEGGSKNPASVYGMARELQFTTLPDLFFGTFVRSSTQVDETVDKLDFNEAVKRVLKRKLYSFMRWKEETEKELKSRKIMTVKYLQQHYDSIKLYLSWVKPYLRNIRRMQSQEKMITQPDIVAAFEASMVEIEILGKFLPRGNKDIMGCMLATFEYRTRPSLNYQAEGYQRGPIHVGETKITLRGYSWTAKHIENFKGMKELDDLDLLSTIDASIAAAMDSLGDELRKYLEEARGVLRKEVKKEPPKVALGGILEPFTSVFKGAGELGKAFRVTKRRKKVPKQELFRIQKEKNAAKEAIKGRMWITYKNYKKAHKMMTW